MRIASPAYNADVQTQLNALTSIMLQNKTLCDALDRAGTLGLDAYYIGAGCVAQTVWNHICGNRPEYGIKDIDFVYFDAERTDYESENSVVQKVTDQYKDLGIEVDVKNQARVHLWYKERFGYEIAPYASLEAAINTWPTTATSIGIRKDTFGAWKVYAPFGLNDLFGMVVRANKAQITSAIYEAKVSGWLKKWPDLTVIPWNEPEN